MSTSFVSKPTVSSTVRLLPLLVSFDEEIDIRRNLLEIPRYRHLSFENSLQLPSELERIVISGHEQLLSKYYEEIRRPTCRLIGMTDHRFHDPRIDALVYAYLPANTPHTLLERTIDNALDHIHLIHVREQINERLRGVTREIEELNKIGAALSAEHHLDSLLELILTKSRHITNADAGSLYLVEAAEEKTRRRVPSIPPRCRRKRTARAAFPPRRWRARKSRMRANPSACALNLRRTTLSISRFGSRRWKSIIIRSPATLPRPARSSTSKTLTTLHQKFRTASIAASMKAPGIVQSPFLPSRSGTRRTASPGCCS